jgi:ubiquinol-cytochrome c reductase cytochrome b subunit
MWDKIKNWLEIRIGLEEIIRTQCREYKMPKGANFWSTLGFVTLIAVMVQVITGMLLLLYYIPHPSLAFDSVQTITNEVPFGWLVRLVHNVGSNLIVAMIILHLLHVFFRGAFKAPRELTWITGGLVLLIILASCISGLLLPWSQAGYWSTTVICSMPSFIPKIGHSLASFLRGGEVVSAFTLGRFFSLHVVILPCFMLAFALVHVFLIRRQGLSSSPALVPKNMITTTFQKENHSNGQPCFPHFSVKRLCMVFLYFAVLFFILTFIPNIFMPVGANMPADLLKTPEVIKPPWFFLAQYQMVKSIPNQFFGIAFQAFTIFIFLFFPFIDAGEDQRSIKKRPFLMSFMIGLIILWCALTLWGMK